MTRTEFGAPRTTCACDDCRTNCEFMPGYLLPADLDRMIPAGVDPFEWSVENLLASPGATVIKAGKIMRVPTLVPAVKADGSCKHYVNGLCQIHEVAPFGCAFFDCGPDPRYELSGKGLVEVIKAWDDATSLYRRLWRYLYKQGKTQRSPNELRDRMHTEMARRAEAK